MDPRRTVHELFPAFALELEELSGGVGRPEIAAQIRALPVVARCSCGQDNCAHFYTAPPPDGAYGEGHSNILLPSKRGLVVLDLVGDRVVGVEVLGRPLRSRAVPVRPIERVPGRRRHARRSPWSLRSRPPERVRPDLRRLAAPFAAPFKMGRSR